MATNSSVSFGKVTDLRYTSKYFEDAYWTDEDGKKITEALIGDTVKIHIKTKKFPKAYPYIYRYTIIG